MAPKSVRSPSELPSVEDPTPRIRRRRSATRTILNLAAFDSMEAGPSSRDRPHTDPAITRDIVLERPRRTNMYAVRNCPD